MDSLQVKVIDNTVHVNYTSLFNPEESFYGEFNLNEYREKLNETKMNHKSEISNNYGKLKFIYENKEFYVTLSKNGTETQIREKNLSDKLFI